MDENRFIHPGEAVFLDGHVSLLSLPRFSDSGERSHPRGEWGFSPFPMRDGSIKKDMPRVRHAF